MPPDSEAIVALSGAGPSYLSAATLPDPVLRHLSSLTALEIKGWEKATSGVSLLSVFHSQHF